MNSIFSVLLGDGSMQEHIPNSSEKIDATIEALKQADIDSKGIYILENALRKLSLYNRLLFADKDKRMEVIDTVTNQLAQELCISADTVKETIVNILYLIEWKECSNSVEFSSMSDGLLRQLADKDEEARFNYALRCFEQKIVGADKDAQYKEALRCFILLAANGNNDARYYCGEIYLWGYGTARDCALGLDYCRQAAEGGNGNALNRLGMLYLKGNSDAGIEKNTDAAKDWFLKAADTGLSVAYENVGYIYEQPETLDMDQSIHYYEEAANIGSASAQRHLGYIFENNKDYEDLARAKFWYEKAAAQGNVVANNDLGVMYLDAHGVSYDIQKAKNYFTAAAEKGFSQSQYELGAIYNRDKIYQQAAYWYKQAAKSNHVLASNNLGILYGDGHLGTPNYLLAYCYCKKAANAGNETARNNAAVYLKLFIKNAPVPVNVKTIDNNLDFYLKTFDSDDPLQAELIKITQDATQEIIQEQREKQQVENNTLHCPACKSTQVTAKTKGFRLGKALLGGALFGGVGLLGGAVGSNETRLVCLKCGYEWTPGSLVSSITDTLN